MDDQGIHVDRLAVGLTRPSTIGGVTYPAVLINIVVSVEAFIWTHNLLWWLICVPIHGIFYLICLNDPRAFDLLLVWARTKARTLILTRRHWSASSYSPLAFRAQPWWRLFRKEKK